MTKALVLKVSMVKGFYKYDLTKNSNLYHPLIMYTLPICTKVSVR